MAVPPRVSLREALSVLPRDLTSLDDLSLRDVEALRLILLGASVVDWKRLAFENREQVDQFLRLCLFDPDSPSDQAWMRAVVADAVAYLRETFRYRVAEPVANPREIHDLFLFASGTKEPRYHKIACIVLKVCHVIHHIEGRDLYHRLPLAEESFGVMAEERVMHVCRQMMDAGFPIIEASSSSKSRTSLVTKLLQKAETLAAQIYDRTRFRVVTESPDDVVPVLFCLTQRLFPFNLVVPGQTQNTLIDFRALCKATPAWSSFVGDLQFGVDFAADEKLRRRKREPGARNEFSGSSYRVLNFVVDLPLRIEDAQIAPDVALATAARTVFCLVEIQIIDADTARANEEGENNHDRYKHRQKLRVLRRLSRGLVVPRKAEPSEPS